MDAMGLPSGGAVEEKEEDGREGEGVFSRLDLSSFNTYYASHSLNSIESTDSPSHQDPAREKDKETEQSWCTKQLEAEIAATIPADALSSTALSQDTYQSQRHQQPSSIPDPHLQMSLRNTSKTNSETSLFGSVMGSEGNAKG